ncbi:hypothetical protein ACFXKC_46815 [Streptomyces sp. NPDC059340]|uniref:hypothetical protein n=1 Tax=Streptomyces TaxID=1883 RepID=UPI003694EFA2
MPRPGAVLHDRIIEPIRLARERYRPRPARGGDPETARLVHAGRDDRPRARKAVVPSGRRLHQRAGHCVSLFTVSFS